MMVGGFLAWARSLLYPKRTWELQSTASDWLTYTACLFRLFTSTQKKRCARCVHPGTAFYVPQGCHLESQSRGGDLSQIRGLTGCCREPDENDAVSHLMGVWAAKCQALGWAPRMWWLQENRKTELALPPSWKVWIPCPNNEKLPSFLVFCRPEPVSDVEANPGINMLSGSICYYEINLINWWNFIIERFYVNAVWLGSVGNWQIWQDGLSVPWSCSWMELRGRCPLEGSWTLQLAAVPTIPSSMLWRLLHTGVFPLYLYRGLILGSISELVTFTLFLVRICFSFS